MVLTRWIVAAMIVGFGTFTLGNWTSWKWVALTLFLYAIPLMLQFSRHPIVRAYALWFGLFLVLQTLVAPLVVDRNYKTLPPNMAQTIKVIGDAIPGISGIQRITSDNRGYRVTRSINYDAKPGDTYRVFAIGASTTAQMLMDDRRTWTHLLQEHLQESGRYGSVEVINTGVSGARALQHLATLRRIADHEPDLVIFLVGINDWNRHIWNVLGWPQGRKAGIWRSATKFDESLLGLVLKRMLSRPDVIASDKIRPEYGDYYSSQNNSLTRPSVKHFAPERVSDEYAAIMQQIGDFCRDHDVTCMFATQPTAYHEGSSAELRRQLWMTPPNTAYTLDMPSLIHTAKLYNSFLLESAAQRGFPSCDIASHFEAEVEYLYDDCHFNLAGSKLMSDLMATCVSRLSQ